MLNFKKNRAINLICLGRAGVDLYPIEREISIIDAPAFEKYVGGSPANIAAAFSKLGGVSGFIGKVSNDQFGQYVIRYLKSINIDTSNIISDNTGTRTSLAIAERKADNCDTLFYRNGAADLYLKPEDISEVYIKNATALIISGTALSQSPSREAVFMALHYARKHSTIVFFDIDYRNYSWSSKEETSLYYSLAAEKSDVVIGTREEYDAMEYTVLPGNKDDRKTAARLFRFATSIAVIKHGKSGSIAYDSEWNEYHGRIYMVEVKKPYGAGDAFAGSFIYHLMQGESISSSLNKSAAAASIIISNNSCSEASPTLNELSNFIKKYTC
ncbi:MAG TPA: 5-dehydro-2-deoxygluconokinase [Victivallales bacterium]|nr:5-dehydro-2-deoxygluconokinase [Victivallales bacterium]